MSTLSSPGWSLQLPEGTHAYSLTLVRFSEFILAQPRWLIAIVAVSVTLAVGFFDYITTWELSLFVFYAVPIFLVAWHGSRPWAIVVALVCGVIWFFANSIDHPYVTVEGYLWATLNRAAYFVMVAFGGTAMRVQREESTARIAAIDRARELERELLRVGEREQMRIGQDLHDGVCQNLAAIGCATECLRADLEAGRVPEPRQVALIQRMLTDTVVEARSLARGIFPVQMDAEGLPAAIQELVNVTNQLRQTAIGFETRGEIRIQDPQVAMHLYRIAQESLSNAMRHSGASRVFVSLICKGPLTELAVDDDGRGLPSNGEIAVGMGLRTIRYRAQLIGARLEIATKSGGGTLVRCSIELAHDSEIPKHAA
jgi:signal transduction histidine kinase